MHAIGKAWLILLVCGAAAPASESPPAEPAQAETDAAAPVEARRIDEPFGHAWLGAADGDVTLVVFADYACPACRDAQPVIDALISADPKLRVVYRILINEDEGKEAARASLAIASGNGNWAAFHRALDGSASVDAAAIAAAMAAAGIDPHSLPSLDEAAWLDSPILAELMNNDALISQRRGKAVPAWVIGHGDALNGFDLATLKLAVAKARGGGKPKP